ncbi:flagellar brake protein [Ureibacillus acetophenoni]|uniref:C-di-GMP-binding flagellar brake protein YcgR n=1 Tax=Ureibacillus acetophenoni TaxID=614649 RepID=A0A285U7W9_9BACL|nr:flagellar brake domain-containing protein [Ureibacillus acetophenoni]SOC37767.1 c-di-GMP-binding flagellar brake protein YcgR [Ureibacillus acetophenoni]
MEIKIGTVLTLEPIPAYEKSEKFHCKVVEQSDRVLYIDYPINSLTKKTAFLIDGSQFRATFVNEDETSYAFNTEVIGRKLNNIPMIMLTLPPVDEFIKVQRREFVRVKTTVDVAVEFENQYFQFVSQDISAGGLALILNSDVPFKDGDQIELTIVLPYSNGDIRYVRTNAYIVRIFEKNGLKLASTQFVELEDVVKQHILRFCFERQLILHRNELKTV